MVRAAAAAAARSRRVEPGGFPVDAEMVEAFAAALGPEPTGGAEADDQLHSLHMLSCSLQNMPDVSRRRPRTPPSPRPLLPPPLALPPSDPSPPAAPLSRPPPLRPPRAQPSDSERPKSYVPRNPYPTPSSFPQTPALFDSPATFEKVRHRHPLLHLLLPAGDVPAVPRRARAQEAVVALPQEVPHVVPAPRGAEGDRRRV